MEGFRFTTDENGNIINFNDIIAPLAAQLEQAQTYAKSFVGQEESDESKAADEAVDAA
jgi:hypothetical protein